MRRQHPGIAGNLRPDKQKRLHEAAFFVGEQRLSFRLVLANHRNVDGSSHIGMQGNDKLRFADDFQRTFRHADGSLLDIEAQRLERLGDIGVCNRTEETAIDTRLTGDGDRLSFQLCTLSLSNSQLFSGNTLKLDTTSFELGQIGGIGTLRLALRDQVVTGITVLDMKSFRMSTSL